MQDIDLNYTINVHEINNKLPVRKVHFELELINSNFTDVLF